VKKIDFVNFFIRKVKNKMNQIKISDALKYAESLEGIPFRWFVPGETLFKGDDAFWCENSPAPSAEEIKAQDKSIVCTGLPNLMRRFCGLTIPGLGKEMRGKFKEDFKACPGGTGTWYSYLRQNKRIEKLDMSRRYPKGTLLIARFKGFNKDQGHLAVIFDDVDESKTINDQVIVHATCSVAYTEINNHKDHGSVKIEPFRVSNELYRFDKISYYKFVCLPENWLNMD
jgi:hypothetical protein